MNKSLVNISIWVSIILLRTNSQLVIPRIIQENSAKCINRNKIISHKDKKIFHKISTYLSIFYILPFVIRFRNRIFIKDREGRKDGL